MNLPRLWAKTTTFSAQPPSVMDGALALRNSAWSSRPAERASDWADFTKGRGFHDGFHDGFPPWKHMETMENYGSDLDLGRNHEFTMEKLWKLSGLNRGKMCLSVKETGMTPDKM